MKEELCNLSSSAESVQNWEARALTVILKNQQPTEECIQPIQEQKPTKIITSFFWSVMIPKNHHQNATLRILLRNFKENNSQNKKKATEIDQELRKAET